MRSLFFSVLAVLASVSVTAARAQDAYISMFGVFHNPGDQHDFTFDLNRSVSSSETLRFQTFAYAGGTNAAGTTFPGGGIDSVLQLFDSGGAPHGVNDDIFPPANRDSLLTWPGVVGTGIPISPDPLTAGSYRLNLSEFNNDDAGDWAVDLVAPANAFVFRGSSAIGSSELDALTAGNGAQVLFDGSYSVNGVQGLHARSGADMVVTSYLDIGTTTDGVVSIQGSGTTLTTNTVGSTFLDWGKSGGEATVSIGDLATATFGATHVNMATDADPLSRTTFLVFGAATATFNSLNIGTGEGRATVLINDPNSAVSQNGTSTVTIGGNALSFGSGYGFLRMGNQGTFNSGTGGVVINSSGAVHLLSGGVLNANGDMTIASSGGNVGLAAGVVLEDEGLINSGNVFVGTTTNNGSALIDGAVVGIGVIAQWNLTGSMSIGATGFGSGVVDITNGGLMYVTDNVTVGGSTDTTGRLTVQLDGQIAAYDSLFVEQNGTVELLSAGTYHAITASSFIVDSAGTFNHEDGRLTINAGTFDPGTTDYTISGSMPGDVPTLQLLGGATANIAGNVVIADTGDATIEVFGIGSNLTAGPFLAVGNDGNGTLDIRAGGLVSGGYVDIGVQTGDGHVVVQHAGSTLTASTQLIVGDLTSGSLSVLLGAHVDVASGANATIGAYIGPGDVTVSGDGSQWNVSNDLHVGERGQGTLLVDSGGSVLAGGNVYLGSKVLGVYGPGDGSVTVAGTGLAGPSAPSQMMVAGSLYVGGDATQSVGTGLLNVQGGARVSVDGTFHTWSGGTTNLLGSQIVAGSFTVDPSGNFTHEDGTLTVEGGTFDPGTSGYTISGANPGDEPTLELLGGATALFTDLVQIGSTGDAAMTVMGTGSRFTSSHAFMDIGWIGSGRLDVSDKGSVDQTGGVVFNLGVAQNASGTVTVDGVDAEISAGDLIIVGDHGEGHFDITGGARVTASRLWIAHYADAQPSDMLVSGTGGPGAPSLLQISGNASIGGEEIQSSGVAANLVVENGGQVLVGDVLRVWSAGTVELRNATVSVPNSFMRLNGGTLRGDGTVEGDLSNAGTVSPGQTIGLLTIDGGYEQDPAGTLEIEIANTGPTQFDRLQLTGGEVLLAGTLDVTLLGGFAPHAGDSFEILSGASLLSGTFTNEVLPQLTGALDWNVNYDMLNNRVLLEVVTPYSADFDLDGDVDNSDLAIWEGAFGVNNLADANGDGSSDGADLLLWQSQYTGNLSPLLASAAPIPEPASAALTLVAICLTLGRRRPLSA